MKKSTFGLLASLSLVLTPVAAFAQDSQQNLQINQSGAAAVGEGNYIQQTTDQYSNQTQLGINGYGEPSSQTSVQDNLSEASAVGGYNVINQGVYQENGQTNADVNAYPEYSVPQY
jgi:hypothetical protein